MNVVCEMCVAEDYSKIQLLYFCGHKEKWHKIWKNTVLAAFSQEHKKVHKITKDTRYGNIKPGFLL